MNKWEVTSHQAKQGTISGGLLKIYGLGVLITGDSGVGKSECALELICRGHRFVSDDVTQIVRTANNKLIGSAPSLSRDFMEIRGLGIINIRRIFNPKSICRKAEIKLVIKLEKWEQGKEHDRLGLKLTQDYEILDKKIPQITIPVALGRNIAALVEVACKVHILREKGCDTSREIVKKLDHALSHRE